MKTITLFAEKDVPVKLDLLVENLNRLCKHVQFRKGKTAVRLPKKRIRHPDAYKQLPTSLGKETKNDFMTVVYTLKQYHNNYFFESHGNQVILSFFGWEYLTNLSINNGAVFFMADLLALDIDGSYRHQDTTGCVYDFRRDKTGVDKAMRLSYFCTRCLSRLSNKKLSVQQNQLLGDLQPILNDLGSASKWNKDIIDLWAEQTETRPNNPGVHSPVLTAQDFIPDDGDANQLDLSRPSIKRLCGSYLELTDSQLPNEKKGKVFENFSTTLFGLIKGWRLLDKNLNLGDCEIDLAYNISKGPKELQAKLGDRIYIECKNRTNASDSRDISHFILNLKTRNLTGGIFFSMAGITGYSPDNLQNIDAAYRRIVDVCRQEKIFILPFVSKDIEAVRNGKNLVSLLEEHIDRFYMI
jgi:hypothetical protein